MIGTTCTFGDRAHLLGTHCSPQAPEAGRATVAFILLNAGVIHRIGPRRFNVKLARELARQGFHSLRFDLSGLGDSGTATAPRPYEEQVREDLKAAMDALAAASGVQRFVIAGICSGAQAALNVAPQDARVAGLWMLDGPAYPTLKSKLIRMWLTFQRAPADVSRRWLRKLVSSPNAKQEAAMRQAASTDNPRGTPTQQAYADTLEQLHDRGVKVYLMHTSDRLWQYSYDGQFRDTFSGRRFVDAVQCERLPEADHTLTALAVQRDVMDRVSRWATGHWRTA